MKSTALVSLWAAFALGACASSAAHHAGAGTTHIDGPRCEVQAGATVFMPADGLVRFQNGPEETAALQVFSGPAPAAKYERGSTVEPRP